MRYSSLNFKCATFAVLKMNEIATVLFSVSIQDLVSKTIPHGPSVMAVVEQ